MYTYLFGPVPSRRLNMSLGVDLVPHKICSLNCVYCECGPTTGLTLTRKEYVPYNTVVKELEHYLANHPAPDYVTFSGSGEPTLHTRIGDIIRRLKDIDESIPVAVLTNGTLLYFPEVRKELQAADLVLPSLDAVSEEVFRVLNRPCPQLAVQQHIEGLIAFRKEYTGTMWLEVMILPGYNDSVEELNLLEEACRRINPERIQLNTLDRPGAVEGLESVSFHTLQSIAASWDMDNVEVIAASVERTELTSYRKDTESAIMGTLRRRPCTAADLAAILGMHVNQINKYLSVLESKNIICSLKRERGVFYQLEKSN